MLPRGRHLWQPDSWIAKWDAAAPKDDSDDAELDQELPVFVENFPDLT